MAQIDEVPMPRIGAVAAVGDLRINVTWNRGAREGMTDNVDLSPIVNAMKYFRRLTKDPRLFATVHPIVFGAAIAWGDDDEIDLSADAILRLVQENMTGDDLRAFIKRQGLTETALAAMLCYSRRQIVGYINEKREIPRVVALACHYIEMCNAPHEEAPNPQLILLPQQLDPDILPGTVATYGAPIFTGNLKSATATATGHSNAIQ